MSGLGHSRRFERAPGTSACHPIPDMRCGAASQRDRQWPAARSAFPRCTGFDALTFVTGYFFIFIVIRHETTAAARWALPLIVRTLNDAITVAVWTGFHVCLPVDTSASLTRQPNVMHRASIASVDL
jgi:hypothetical protein